MDLTSGCCTKASASLISRRSARGRNVHPTWKRSSHYEHEKEHEKEHHGGHQEDQGRCNADERDGAETDCGQCRRHHAEGCEGAERHVCQGGDKGGAGRQGGDKGG